MTWLPRKTVIVPIDFSEDSFAALGTALELADDPSHVHVIHVLPVIEPAEPGVIWHTIDDKSRSDSAEQALRAKLEELGRTEIRIAIRFGDPGHEIAHYAEHFDAGLVILPSHGRTGLKRLLIGSVAERVVRLAHCPVLVLKK
jgi:nucleotide-binding universal stress UspA family protein